MRDPDRNRRCPHGYPTITVADTGGEGWFADVVQDCPRCPRMMVVGIPYKPGTPPPSPGDRRASVEDEHTEAPPAPAEAPAAVEQPVAPKKSAEMPEAHNCPTCGRPVVEGAPYDLPALRQALTTALKAIDELAAGAAREQDALRQLDGGL